MLTYLRHILESIDHPDLVRLTLQYLFGLQQRADDVNTPKTPIFTARRRKSQTLLARLAEEDQPTPELFNLADLIMASLRSRSQQTITATLHILSAMLKRPHHQSLTALLRTRPVQASDTKRTVGGHEKEVEALLSLAESLTAFQDLESSYERHVLDIRNNLEMHPCTVQLLSLPVSNKTAEALKSERRELHPKLLILDDPTLKSLTNLLDNFFQNDVETNLGTTQVLIDLTLCGYMRLEGWLLSSPGSYEYPNLPSPPPQTKTGEGSPSQDSEGLPLDKLYRLRICRIPPRIAHTASSPIIQSLTQLTKTVDAFRRTIPSFDAHLMSCRGIIEPNSTSSSPAMTPSRSPTRIDENWAPQPTNKTTNPSTPVLAPTSVPSRLIPSGAASRTASPRGRQNQNDLPPELGTPPSLVARFGHLQTSPSRSPPTRSATHTPSKTQSRSPLRHGQTLNPTVTPTVPRIPDVFRRRVRLARSTSSRGPSGAYSRPQSNAVDSSENTDTETSSVEDGTGIGADAAAESTPSKIPESTRTLKRTRSLGSQAQKKGITGHRKTLSSVSMGRGRDGGLADASEDSDEADQGKDEIGLTSPTDGDDAEQRKSRLLTSSNPKTGSAGNRSSSSTSKEEGSKGEEEEKGKERDRQGTISLGTLCTNVIILQEFALELAAVVEVRGALFDEVRYF